jgi:hypothetical protein
MGHCHGEAARHGACPILPSEPIGMPHNFPPPHQCREWSNIDPDGRALEFVQHFQELCSLWGLPVCSSLSTDVTRLDPGLPLKHLRMTPALVPEGLLNHCEGLCSTFPKIGTNFDTHSLFLSLIHHENRHRSRTRLQTNACENCPCPPSYAHLGTLTH